MSILKLLTNEHEMHPPSPVFFLFLYFFSGRGRRGSNTKRALEPPRRWIGKAGTVSTKLFHKAGPEMPNESPDPVANRGKPTFVQLSGGIITIRQAKIRAGSPRKATLSCVIWVKSVANQDHVQSLSLAQQHCSPPPPPPQTVVRPALSYFWPFMTC